MFATKIVFKIYLFALAVFSIFRLILTINHYTEIRQNSGFSDILSLFTWGLRYDLLISGFILILPFIILVVYDFTRYKTLKHFAFWWIFIFFSLSFLMSAGNIPYYNKFYQHITLKAFAWLDQPKVVLGMLVESPKFLLIFIPASVFVYLFYKFLKRIFKINAPSKYISKTKKVFYYLLFLVLIFFSLRGRINHSPLRISDAYRHRNNILNELKLNPVFLLEKSIETYYKDRLHPLQLIPDSTAVKLTQKYLHIDKPFNKNPISRKINYDSLAQKKNVVLVLMESMGAWKMHYFGNTENRTPFLDSLFLKGLSFTNMYSNGIHTYAGIYGLNYGYPEIFDRHPFKGADTKHYYGLPQILKQNGYETAFFIPHNKDFDNLGRFLSQNGYRHIYFEKDYPKDSIRNIWGVDDHFLFNFALKKINKLAEKQSPFLATVLTISDHAPLYLPDWIKGQNDAVRATRFADWSIQDFMKKAAKEPWYDNTVFIFVADHGEGHKRVYDIPLTYNHIPAIIYYNGIEPKIINKFAGQIDIFPTLMHLLQTGYVNTTFGIDQLNEQRPYALFNHDKKYGVIDSTYVLIFDRHKNLGLYKYRQKDPKNYLKVKPEIAQKMANYGKAQIQTTNYILKHNLQEKLP